MKELLLKGIFEAVQGLESFAILDIPDEVISRVAGWCLLRRSQGSESIGWTE